MYDSGNRRDWRTSTPLLGRLITLDRFNSRLRPLFDFHSRTWRARSRRFYISSVFYPFITQLYPILALPFLLPPSLFLSLAPPSILRRQHDTFVSLSLISQLASTSLSSSFVKQFFVFVFFGSPPRFVFHSVHLFLVYPSFNSFSLVYKSVNEI